LLKYIKTKNTQHERTNERTTLVIIIFTKKINVYLHNADYDDDDAYKSGEDLTESHDQGGAKPTMDADATTTREEPFDSGIDSIHW
jgi:hypothetical protein